MEKQLLVYLCPPPPRGRSWAIRATLFKLDESLFYVFSQEYPFHSKDLKFLMHMCLPLRFRSFSSIIFAAFVLCENVVNQKIALHVFYEFSSDNFEAVTFHRKSVSLRSMAVLLSRAQERRSREIRARSTRERAAKPREK